ncbi:hypothetical protein RUND412_010168 [Rhizina undulata]
MALPTPHLYCASDLELSVAYAEEAPLKTKPFTRKLFLLGFILPLFPWIAGSVYGLILPYPHPSPEAKVDCNGDPKKDADGRGSLVMKAEKEYRYWGWVCLFALVSVLVLGTVTAMAVAYDYGVIGGPPGGVGAYS